MSKCVARNLFKSVFYPRNFAIQIRSIVCDRRKYLAPKEVDKKKTCWDQVTAIYSSNTKPVSHVIMDLDGVILDSNHYNAIAHEEYLMKWKKNLKTSTKYKILGLRNLDAGKIITDEYNMPFGGEVYAHGVWQLQRSLYRQAKITQGVDDLVCYFLQQKMPLALISSVHPKAFKTFYKNLKGLEKNFCHVVRSDQVANGKPNPDMLIKAARSFYGGPKNLSKFLVIDSSYQGALAAKAAGMQVILYTDDKMPKDMQAEATIVLHDINKFDPTEFHLPPRKK